MKSIYQCPTCGLSFYDRQVHRDYYCTKGQFGTRAPAPRPAVDLLDTSGCARCGDCISCGASDSYSLTVQVPSMALVACLRTCSSCGADAADRLDAGRIDEAIQDHCEHLGLTRPRMRGVYLAQIEKGHAA
ncbi:hypothetical protein GCM10022223_47150 [Kineosporia mesophila]|uniref:Uncharacterized protein n=1 Tax=Kineosporia mesophila TaxID=566012 RepID=A0ABP7A4B5_9ACTN|nr:hypothetical protein [Kineosporia mesophila]MCD5353823.1 hypothetical protein [Kineosporia mesophila]